VYEDNFYNSMRSAQTLLDSNMRVCGTVRANRGIPLDLEGEGRCLKRGQSAFRRNGDVMVWVWKDRTCANDKCDWSRNNFRQQKERPGEKHGNIEALCCCTVQ
jgi:hypothetical protein